MVHVDLNLNNQTNNTSIVVVLADTNDMCIIRNPKTLKAKAKFKTAKAKNGYISDQR